MKLLQINSVANIGSTGRIAEQIGQAAMKAGWESYIAYGREAGQSQSHLIKIGSQLDVMWHGVVTRLFDRHGLASKRATKKFVSQIKEIQPDIIHLHNIHGYYLNYEVLFEYLSKADMPVVWTLHDCWAMTGHCSYFEYVGCDKWKVECNACPNLRSYPISLLCDNSMSNYRLKRQVFNSLKNLTIVPVSNWIAQIVQESYLHNNEIHTISNGIDLSQFDIQSSDNVMQLKRHLGIKDEFVLLGVASIWDKRKGLSDFEKLSEIIPDEWKLVLVGLDEKQIKHLPSKIIGIKRTQSVRQLAELYSMATAFVNLTYEDTYPTTNLESIACGTPVITYRTGGNPESLTEQTGYVVNKGDINEVVKRVQCIIDNGPDHYKKICRDYALLHFNKEDKFKEYIELYKKILKQ